MKKWLVQNWILFTFLIWLIVAILSFFEILPFMPEFVGSLLIYIFVLDFIVYIIKKKSIFKFLKPLSLRNNN